MRTVGGFTYLPISSQVFGDASVAQSLLSHHQNGDFFSINWGFGIAVMLGAYVSGGISGGHLNPAVTLALAISKKFKWKKVAVYFAGQYLGAFLAATVVYAVYYGKYKHFSTLLISYRKKINKDQILIKNSKVVTRLQQYF